MDYLHFTAFLFYLKTVPDPRKARGKVFPWEFLLAIVCAAMLSGQLNGSAIAQSIYRFSDPSCVLSLLGGPSHRGSGRRFGGDGACAIRSALAPILRVEGE